MNQENFDNMGMQWTLGDLMRFLEKVPADTQVPFSALKSYRGYYDELAACPGESTAGALRKHLREEVLDQFLLGWKGGKYFMSEPTVISVAYPGCLGSALLGMTYVDGKVEYVTEEEDLNF